MATIDNPLWTLELNPNEYTPPSGSIFVYGSGSEHRARRDTDFFKRCTNNHVKVLSVDITDEETISVSSGDSVTELWLYDWGMLAEFFDDGSAPLIVLDVTGLTHRVWAPILGSLVKARSNIHLVYTEAKEYRRNSSSRFYNLSEKIEGISPLPGFERVLPANREVPPFVPLVGFEGPRLQYIMDQIDTEKEQVFPIIGLPGFQPGFHFETFLANRSYLEPSAHLIHYAKANCPFDAFYSLEKIHRKNGYKPITISPIGTKPHGIGAVLYSLAKGENVELIYDNPLRSSDRTIGAGKLCVYDISSFVQGTLFFEPVSS